jgi:hypothetical protein
MRVAVFVIAGLLAGCASDDKSPVTTAATTPLSDLNLVNTPIPEVLRQAQRQPYAVPEAATCENLAAAVRSLDDVLGPDLDAPPPEGESGAADRGGKLAEEALQRAAEGVIPFRGWIRKLSGAERRSRRVEAAIEAGTARRAFLKGFAKASACP